LVENAEMTLSTEFSTTITSTTIKFVLKENLKIQSGAGKTGRPSRRPTWA